MKLLNERIKKLRKALDLTQREFGERIGVKGNTIAQYELGRNEPIDAVLSLICREFRVNKKWLREGTGEMFLPTDCNDDIAKLIQLLYNEDTDSFKNRFVSILAKLNTNEWEFLEKYTRELYDGISVTETNKK